jgi:predicted ATP-dependent serine protease
METLLPVKDQIIQKPKRIRTWSTQQIVEKEFKEIDLGKEFEQLIGKPTLNFCSIIFGKAKGGKSTCAIKLAKQLCVYGKVLYVASEELISKSLKNRIILVGLTDNDNIRFAPIRGVVELERTIKRTHPKFIFIDSAQACDIKLKDFQRLKNVVFKNRKSWHIVSQASNSGNMMLPQGWVHETDVKIQLVNGVAISQGRFNPEGTMEVLQKEKSLFNQ